MSTQLQKIQPKAGALKSVPSKADMIAEALEKGMKIPWMGIRPDLRLHKGTADMQGETTYVIEDPVSGHHYEIGEAEAQFFLCLVTEDDIRAAVNKLLRTTSLRPSIEDVISFLRMLQTYQLALMPEEGASDIAEKQKEMRQKAKPRWSDMTLLQKQRKLYFLQLPIVRPDPFLNLIYPWFSPLWSKPLLFLYSILGVVGLVMALQQIELYWSTVSYMYTPKGAVTFILALTGVKVLHEFGHALAAKHYGLYVRRMGIYFFMFVPMLYTDATEAWKLPDRKGRLYIGGAGILTELCIAGISLFFWAVLPNGLARSIAFYVSGASIISTFLANLNPLMRFDGYYLLMDYLRINGLRTRAMMMYQYYRRRLLVDWQGPKPEEHPWERGLVVFGIFTSLYMFVIYFSVVATIYMLIPNLWVLVGLSVGISIFLLTPIIKEIKDIIAGRKYWGAWWRVMMTFAVLAGGFGALFIPMSNYEKLPAHLLYQDVAEVRAPGRGDIISDLPPLGTPVQKGDLLVRIQDVFMEQELAKAESDIAQVDASLKNIAAGGAQGGYRKWLMAERQRLVAGAEKLREALSQMEVRAPISGQVLDVNKLLRKGASVYRREPLLTVGDDRSTEVRAYIHEKIYQDLKNKTIDTAKIFFKDLETPSLMGKFIGLLHFPVSDFPNVSLFDFAGGPILSSMSHLGATQTGAGGRKSKDNPTASTDMSLKLSNGVQAKEPYFPMTFSVAGVPGHVRHGTPCFIRIKTDEHSIMDSIREGVYLTLAKIGVL